LAAIITDDIDLRIRAAAFEFLTQQVRRAASDLLPRTLLAEGFRFLGQRVPILGPQGIFKPKVLSQMPLSITTIPVEEGERAPYRDATGDDGLLRYCYRGTDQSHRDNVGLRAAMVHQAPLIYCHGVVPGHNVVVWPVFIVGDSPADLSFTVSVDERTLVALGSVNWDDPATRERRRYLTREVQQRLHQDGFRQRVMAAYQEHCAICRLHHAELLEAAHILPDGHPRGEPVVSNGLALCKLHHAAFDLNIVGIRPDCKVEIRIDVLKEFDGPMLKHGLQGFHGQRLWTPVRSSLQPKPEFLEERYAMFRQAG
jgi:putative restriction endonuclease